MMRIKGGRFLDPPSRPGCIVRAKREAVNAVGGWCSFSRRLRSSGKGCTACEMAYGNRNYRSYPWIWGLAVVDGAHGMAPAWMERRLCSWKTND